MKHFSFVSFAACAALLAGCGGPAAVGSISAIPADGILLKVSGKPGDKETIEIKSNMSLDATGQPGAPKDGKMSINMTIVTTFTLETVKDGKLTYKLKFDEAKMEGMPAGTPDPLATTKGKDATIVMDETGKVVSTSGEAGSMSEQAGTGLNFPTKKLKVGDTWEVTQKNQAMGGMEVTSINKLEGMEMVDGVNCVVITSTAKEGSPIRMPQPGKTWVNPANGRVVKAHSVIEMDMMKLKATVNMRKIK